MPDTATSSPDLSADQLYPNDRIAQLIILGLIMGLEVYAKFLLFPLQENMSAALGLSDNQMALLQGPALQFSSAVIAIPLGVIADRYTRIRWLFAAAALTAIGTVFTAFAPGYATLLLARCLIGLSTIVAPLVFSLVADLFPESQRGRAIMVVGFGQLAGNSVAFAAGGALMAHAPHPDDWRWVVGWLATPLFAALPMLLLLKEPPRRGVTTGAMSLQAAGKELWGYRKVLLTIVIGVGFAEIAMGAIRVWTAPALSRGFALAPNQVGNVMAACLLIGGIAGPFAGGMLADYCQKRGGPRLTTVALICIALVSVPVGAFALLPSAPLFSVAFTLFKALTLMIACMGITMFTLAVPNKMRGLSVGVLGTSNMIFSGAIAPVSVSVLSEGMGGNQIHLALTLVCAVSCLGAAVIFLAGLPQRRL